MENDLAGMISIASFLRLCYNPPIPLIDAENQIIFSGRLRPFYSIILFAFPSLWQRLLPYADAFYRTLRSVGNVSI